MYCQLDGCPDWAVTEEKLDQIIKEKGINTEPKNIHIGDLVRVKSESSFANGMKAKVLGESSDRRYVVLVFMEYTNFQTTLFEKELEKLIKED